MALRLNVNFIWHGKFVDAGEEIPAHMAGHVPAWCVKKHSIRLPEALRLCEDRHLLRERRAKEKAVALEAARRKLGLKEA
jgi:hypothetical protein